MSVNLGSKTQVDGLVLSLDTANPKAYNGTNWYDIVGGQLYNNTQNPAWANNIEELTITFVWHKLATVLGYANHPINKWNNSYLDNASFIFYNFGTDNGAGVNLVGWYGNTTAAANSGWSAISNQATVSVGIHHIAFQYNWINGGQLWVDGVKASGRLSSGKLGQTSVVANTSAMGINGPAATAYDRVLSANFYNIELPDSAILEDYQRNKRKYRL